ncbi:MAG: hypothetical protein PHU85_10750, partial [Phycisphaerae bacterium]|nr:hypothetical protein [Phycisphaerae bacterium]
MAEQTTQHAARVIHDYTGRHYGRSGRDRRHIWRGLWRVYLVATTIAFAAVTAKPFIQSLEESDEQANLILMDLHQGSHSAVHGPYYQEGVNRLRQERERILHAKWWRATKQAILPWWILW